MYISRAKKADLPAIQALTRKYGSIMSVDTHHLNKRDIALQARDDFGKLVGFVYVGLMGADKIAYIDKLMVDPEYAHQGIPQLLFKEGLLIALKRGVREVFACVKQDTFHNKMLVNGIKACFPADPSPYSFFRADPQNIYLELKNAGVI